VSNTWYYSVTFDTETGEFVLDDELIDVAEELAETTDYPQPGG
jgi:hypothetical protein